ncbi:MAG: CoA transferase [Gammaproteobacteria bacterium]|nr:CoA transferase [Gammaproteobacteria bacterium]
MSDDVGSNPVSNRAEDPVPSGDAAAGPLHGVRVLDLTSVIMGPLATQVLGDLGAEVISVENAEGNTNRAMGQGAHPELSGVAMNLLRNKRSIALDLKHPEGRAAFLRLAASSDVLVTNLRPGPLSRLRLAYADVKAHAPRIIFCRAHGYSVASGRADAPAYDDIIQSASGIGDLFGRLGMAPMLLPTLVADKVSGLTITYAILAALFHRERSGSGQELEIPMIDVMRAFVLTEHGCGAIPEPPVASAGYPRILTPERKPQRTADGWINVLPYRKEDYQALFHAGGRDDLLEDPRFATRASRIEHSDSLYRDVSAVLAGNTTEHWLQLCAQAGIPATRAASIQDLVDELPVAEHPHAGRYRRIPPPVRFGATPASVRRAAPLIGEHGAEVLAEVGYSSGEIDALRACGALTLRSDPEA